MTAYTYQLSKQPGQAGAMGTGEDYAVLEVVVLSGTYRSCRVPVVFTAKQLVGFRGSIAWRP